MPLDRMTPGFPSLSAKPKAGPVFSGGGLMGGGNNLGRVLGGIGASSPGPAPSWANSLMSSFPGMRPSMPVGSPPSSGKDYAMQHMAGNDQIQALVAALMQALGGQR